MIEFLKSIIGPLLRADARPPRIPHGAHDIEVMRASPRFLAYRYFLISMVFALIGLVIAGSAAAAGFAAYKSGKDGLFFGLAVLGPELLIAGFIAACAFVGARLEYEYRYYVLTDRSLRIRRGIWQQLEATLTYANVQNVRVVQGPLERLFGFASVIVETAGGESHEKDPFLLNHRGIIRGIEDAPALRERILAHLRKDKSSGLGDLDDPHHRAHAGPPQSTALLAEIRDEARALEKALRG